ncbi:hypothetical protein Lspi_1746 [Legionella spiritensis]|uniref:Uncharacterized protein n=1 Tax=Legionella spiritensis TaxID=452 RepID=A0A0W0Z1A9_LEGSP|nr:hypothetical protein Lspi_1746 [Legionella spiritensis]SNV30775.1 Uncharacterised protein [Legionella spiritensis]
MRMFRFEVLYLPFTGFAAFFPVAVFFRIVVTAAVNIGRTNLLQGCLKLLGRQNQFGDGG